jgi:RNA polymerase sigma-70 factor (ECF subfamily)
VRAQPGETEDTLLARLRWGDEAAFAALVDDLHGRLLRLAASFTPSRALAEDIVQETWLAVIRGLRGFEGRSSLRTWIFSILVRRARTIAAREARHQQNLGTTAGSEASAIGEWEPGGGRLGLWEEAPLPWEFEDPAAIFQSHEALGVVLAALDALPVTQRQVVLLRDVEDISTRDACNILGLNETNLRVLLHRGRARVRRALDRYVREGEGPGAVARGASAAAGSARTEEARAMESAGLTGLSLSGGGR